MFRPGGVGVIAKSSVGLPVVWQTVTGWTTSGSGYVSTADATPSLIDYCSVTSVLPSSGKHYWEIKLTTEGGNEREAFGLADTADAPTTNNDDRPGLTGALIDAFSIYFAWDGIYYTGNVNQGSSGFGNSSNGDICMMAFDADAGKLWFGKNGSWDGNPAAGTGEAFSGLTGTSYHIVAGNANGSDAIELRTGNASSPTLSYPAPTGFSLLP